MNIERPEDLSENNSTSIAKGFCNVKKSGTGSVNSDNDSGCALDEYSWVPSGLLPEQVILLYFIELRTLTYYQVLKGIQGVFIFLLYLPLILITGTSVLLIYSRR